MAVVEVAVVAAGTAVAEKAVAGNAVAVAGMAAAAGGILATAASKTLSSFLSASLLPPCAFDGALAPSPSSSPRLLLVSPI
jgi:Flp pilus assembly protein TadG